jgi:hypothetical protein
MFPPIPGGVIAFIVIIGIMLLILMLFGGSSGKGKKK